MTEKQRTRTAEEDTWRNRAACLGMDVSIFDGAGQNEREKRNNTLYAKRICRNCVVIDECLLSALEFGDKVGVRGGMSERQRCRALRNPWVMRLVEHMDGRPNPIALDYIRMLVSTETQQTEPSPEPQVASVPIIPAPRPASEPITLRPEPTGNL